MSDDSQHQGSEGAVESNLDLLSEVGWGGEGEREARQCLAFLEIQPQKFCGNPSSPSALLVRVLVVEFCSLSRL